MGKFGGRKVGEKWGGDRDFLSLFVTISLWCGGVMYYLNIVDFAHCGVWYGTFSFSDDFKNSLVR